MVFLFQSDGTKINFYRKSYKGKSHDYYDDYRINENTKFSFTRPNQLKRNYRRKSPWKSPLHSDLVYKDDISNNPYFPLNDPSVSSIFNPNLRPCKRKLETSITGFLGGGEHSDEKRKAGRKAKRKQFRGNTNTSPE